MLVAVSIAASGAHKSALAQESGKTAGTDENGVFSNLKTLSIAQQSEWITVQTVAAKDVSRLVQNLLDQARKENDTIKIVALNDISTQIRVNLRGIEKRDGARQTAADQGDIATANHHFSVIVVYFRRIARLRAEADKVIGGKDIIFGKTANSVSISNSITKEDPTEYNLDIEIIMEQPPHASGFY